MAFSNVKNVSLGGGVSLIIADFTATVGAADQTLAIACGRVITSQVNPQASAEPVDYSGSLYSVSQSGAIATVTIYTDAGISAGTFWALVDQG